MESHRTDDQMRLEKDVGVQIEVQIEVQSKKSIQTVSVPPTTCTSNSSSTATATKMSNKIPRNIEELQSIMQSLGVVDGDCVKFQNVVEQWGFADVLILKEEMEDRAHSVFLDFCREETQFGETLHDLVFSILNGDKVHLNKIEQ